LRLGGRNDEGFELNLAPFWSVPYFPFRQYYF
jgi:hypothetical protein